MTSYLLCGLQEALVILRGFKVTVSWPNWFSSNANDLWSSIANLWFMASSVCSRLTATFPLFNSMKKVYWHNKHSTRSRSILRSISLIFIGVEISQPIGSCVKLSERMCFGHFPLQKVTLISYIPATLNLPALIIAIVDHSNQINIYSKCRWMIYRGLVIGAVLSVETLSPV